MKYLSPEIEALAKGKTTKNSLLKKEISCGIFQDAPNFETELEEKSN